MRSIVAAAVIEGAPIDLRRAATSGPCRVAAAEDGGTPAGDRTAAPPAAARPWPDVDRAAGRRCSPLDRAPSRLARQRGRLIWLASSCRRRRIQLGATPDDRRRWRQLIAGIDSIRAAGPARTASGELLRTRAANRRDSRAAEAGTRHPLSAIAVRSPRRRRRRRAQGRLRSPRRRAGSARCRSVTSPIRPSARIELIAAWPEHRR